MRSLLRDIRNEFQSLRTAYPRFVMKDVDALADGEVPVFVFHTIEADEFDSQLRFLSDNRYRCIGMEEFVRQMQGLSHGTGRDVLLTIDDARSSVWRFGFPLLKKYNCRAILFAIPGWVTEATQVRMNMDDALVGRCAMRDVHAADPSDLSVCNWPELRAMVKSGCIEVHSHSYSHRRGFLPSPIRQFYSRQLRTAPFDAPFSPYLTADTPFTTLHNESFVGLPLFESASILGGTDIYRLPEDLVTECRAAFEELRSETLPRDWSQRLRARLPALYRHNVLQRLTNEALQSERAHEITRARQILQERLGCAADSFCLPFGEGTPAMAALALQHGCTAIFWTTLPGLSTNRPPADISRLVRIKNDFVRRLPGTGRRSVLGVYGAKFTRRLRGVTPY